jgi:tRNA-modifying protein YgfZ
MAEPTAPPAEAYWLERDTLVVRGADAKTWLDGLVTCAVAPVQVGAAAYGLLLSKQGKILTDVWLAFSADARLFLGVAPGRGLEVQALLDRYLVMEDAELSGPVAELSWQVALATPTSLAQAESLASGVAVLGTTRVDVQVTTAPSSHLRRAGDLLARYGVGTHGVDFTDRDNPHEAALDRVAVSWTKGCYLGQEVVCMQDMRGKVKRRLIGLIAAADLGEQYAEATKGGTVSVLAPDGTAVGQVTSAHGTPDGTLLLASIATAALEAPADWRVLDQPVRPASAPEP